MLDGWLIIDVVLHDVIMTASIPRFDCSTLRQRCTVWFRLNTIVFTWNLKVEVHLSLSILG